MESERKAGDCTPPRVLFVLSFLTCPIFPFAHHRFVSRSRIAQGAYTVPTMSSFGRGMPGLGIGGSGGGGGGGRGPNYSSGSGFPDWMRGDGEEEEEEDPDFDPDEDIDGRTAGRIYVDPPNDDDGANNGDGDGDGEDGEEQLLEVEQGVADDIATGGSAGAGKVGKTSKAATKCVTIDFRDGVVPDDGSVSFHWHPMLRADGAGGGGSAGAAGSAAAGAAGGSMSTFVPKTELELAAMTFDEQMAYITAQSLHEAEAAALAESAAAHTPAAAADTDAGGGAAPMDLDTSSTEITDDTAPSAAGGADADAKAEEDEKPPYHMNTETEGGTSSFVYVNPGAFMKVKLPQPAPSTSSGKAGLTARPGGGKARHDSWTLTMEMKIDSLPGDEPHSILQCSHNQDVIQSTVETELYGIGALSIFSEVPKDVFFKPGKWNRISIRYGAAPTPTPQMDRQGRGNMHTYMEQMNRGAPPRKLSVFINGKLSVEVSKGIFATDQGPVKIFLLCVFFSPRSARELY